MKRCTRANIYNEEGLKERSRTQAGGVGKENGRFLIPFEGKNSHSLGVEPFTILVKLIFN